MLKYLLLLLLLISLKKTNSSKAQSAYSNEDHLLHQDQISTITQLDFCAALNKVTDDYTKNFSSIKGVEEETDDDDPDDATYTSEVEITGSLTADIYQTYASLQWVNELTKATDLSTGKENYNQAVSELQNCTLNCGTLTSNEEITTTGNVATYTTHFTILKANSGYEYFTGMEIDVILTFTKDNVWLTKIVVE